MSEIFPEEVQTFPVVAEPRLPHFDYGHTHSSRRTLFRSELATWVVRIKPDVGGNRIYHNILLL